MRPVSRKDLDEVMKYVESYIMDNPEVNRLVDGKQFKPSQIELAVRVGFDRIYNTPPLLRLNITEVPIDSILKSSTICLMETAGIVDLRNSLEYSDSGLNIKETHEDGYVRYVSFFSSFLKELKEWKIATNIERATSPMEGV